MRAYIDNKGMTLIELIISIAISSIVVLMIVSFIDGASETFRRANNEVNLQMEAQTALNQLNNLAMEAKNIIETEPLASEDKRYIIESNTDFYTVILVKSDKKIYLVHKSKSDSTIEDAKTVLYNEAEHLLTEYVKDLTISTIDEKKVVTITLTLSLGEEKDYKVNKKVRLRNAS